MGQVELVRRQAVERGERQPGGDFQGGRAGQPRADGDVAGQSGLEIPRREAVLRLHQGIDAADIVGPALFVRAARVVGGELDALIEIGGKEGGGGRLRGIETEGDAGVDSRRKDEAFIIVGMVAQDLHPARRIRDDGGFHAEVLMVPAAELENERIHGYSSSIGEDDDNAARNGSQRGRRRRRD